MDCLGVIVYGVVIPAVITVLWREVGDVFGVTPITFSAKEIYNLLTKGKME